MNSTNNNFDSDEKNILFKIASDLFSKEKEKKILTSQNTATDSYFLEKSDLKLFNNSIYEYNFNSPKELRDLLSDMWSYQETNYMNNFTAVVTVATFSNKPNNITNEENYVGIPAFIYNF